MKKSKAIVYLKINSNDKKEMKKEEKIARDFCKMYNFEIESIFKDYKDDHSIEDAMLNCEMKKVIFLITNDLSMISTDIYELYDRYVYLRDYYGADLVSVKDGFEFDFDIRLVRGKEYERKLREESSPIY